VDHVLRSSGKPTTGRPRSDITNALYKLS
jgi:hypothetical protein